MTDSYRIVVGVDLGPSGEEAFRMAVELGREIVLQGFAVRLAQRRLVNEHVPDVAVFNRKIADFCFGDGNALAIFFDVKMHLQNCIFAHPYQVNKLFFKIMYIIFLFNSKTDRSVSYTHFRAHEN